MHGISQITFMQFLYQQLTYNTPFLVIKDTKHIASGINIINKNVL